MSDIDVGPSPIEGLGIFAARDFRAGEPICPVHVVREITPDAPLRPEAGERVDHCAYPDGKVVLVAFPERHANHSCDPNAWEMFDGEGSCLVARRDIGACEEITLDYAINTSGGSSWPCACGAARCRGIVEGEFFNLPSELQREYRPYLADWFVRRHRDRLAAVSSRV